MYRPTTEWSPPWSRVLVTRHQRTATNVEHIWNCRNHSPSSAGAHGNRWDGILPTARSLYRHLVRYHPEVALEVSVKELARGIAYGNSPWLQ